MNTKPYLLLSGLLFALVAVAHGIRLMAGWPIQVDQWAIPLWVSGLGTLVPAMMSIWALRLAMR